MELTALAQRTCILTSVCDFHYTRCEYYGPLRIISMLDYRELPPCAVSEITISDIPENERPGGFAGVTQLQPELPPAHAVPAPAAALPSASLQDLIAAVALREQTNQHIRSIFEQQQVQSWCS